MLRARLGLKGKFMNPYAKQRCTNPRIYYQTTQDVLDDDALTSSEKELALKTMAAQMELLDDKVSEPVTSGGHHAPTVSAIEDALSDLGESHGFPEPAGRRVTDAKGIEHIVAAVSGHSDVDTEVCRAARKLSEITRAHVHFVSVIGNVSDPADFGAFASVGAAAVAPQIGIRRLDDERAKRRNEFAELACSCALPDAYSFEVRTGLLDDEIIKVAKDRDASLIIVGLDEKTWLDSILSSDVACDVSTKADRPVLVVPKGSAAQL